MPDDAAIRWIEDHLAPEPCPTSELLYDLVESQSGRTLTPHYVPFDPANPRHFAERGEALDSFHATGAGGRVLDFGPGDGWPGLVVAPWVDEVVGAEGSRRRVAECERNAARMGITNASFLYVAPGEPLPFPDESFDGAMAASSVEQTPDPKATLRELARVLRPGGRLRLCVETLEGYAGGGERAVSLWGSDRDRAHLIVYHRFVLEERVRQYRLTFAMTPDELRRRFEERGARLAYPALTTDLLERLAAHVIEARRADTVHPSVRTLLAWLPQLGFASARYTCSGRQLARRLFERLEPSERPETLEAIDRYLRPIIAVAVEIELPDAGGRGLRDGVITAIK